MHAADAARAPRPALVPRAHEHQEQADRVGAVARDQLVGVLRRCRGSCHPLAVGAQDLALVEQPLERLALLHQADVAHRLGPEPAVQQVHHRVLGAARVLLDGRPALGHVVVDRRVVLVRRQVAEPVPRGVDERVHRVRLTSRRAVARRAGDVEERLVAS